MLWTTGAAAQAAKSATLREPPSGAVHTQHLSQLDLTQRWQLSSRTLERWRHLGRGPAYLKLGRGVMYRLQDIEAYETAHRRDGSERAAAGATAPQRAGLGTFTSLLAERLLKSRASAAHRRGRSA
jgi:hypothetical protein